MVKGCGNMCMKFTLFAFNFIFLVLGIVLMAAGIFVLVKSSELRELMETPDAAAALVLIIGLSIFIVSFFGCCGALQESRCMLVTYAIVVGITFLIEIAAAALILVYSAKFTELARHGLDQAVRNAQPDKPDHTITQIMDNLQWSLKCCGARERSDWRNYHPQHYGISYPKSCCFDPLDNAGGRECGAAGGNQPFEKPCANALDDFLKIFLGILAGFILTSAVLQLIAACFACSLSSASK